MLDYLKIFGAAVAAIALFTGAMLAPALAADLPVPYYKAGAVAPVWSWQQCYLSMISGANTGSAQTGTPTAGAQVGCDYQQAGSPFVWGFVGDASAAQSTIGAAPVSVDVKALANASARLGYAWHGMINFGPIVVTDALLYVKGGMPANFLAPDNSFKAGAGFAAGVEYLVRPCTTQGFEYRFNDVGGVHSHTFLTTVGFRYCG